MQRPELCAQAVLTWESLPGAGRVVWDSPLSLLLESYIIVKHPELYSPTVHNVWQGTEVLFRSVQSTLQNRTWVIRFDRLFEPTGSICTVYQSRSREQDEVLLVE